MGDVVYLVTKAQDSMFKGSGKQRIFGKKPSEYLFLFTEEDTIELHQVFVIYQSMVIVW